MKTRLNRLENILNEEKFSAKGLSDAEIIKYRKKYGENVLVAKGKTTFLRKIVNALTEPMMLILVFALLLTLAINIGNYFSGYEVDPFECLGIFVSIAISVGLTVIMERKSEKAFDYLKSFTDNVSVVCLRNGEKKLISNTEVCVGDVLFFESGERIVADCLVIEETELEVDESTLTGESIEQRKKAYDNKKIKEDNILNSGTYVKNGNAKAIVLAVGADARIGNIALGIDGENEISAPLSNQLNALSKKISVFGAVAALIVFLMTITRSVIAGNLCLETFKSSFLSAIVLIVAAVPEGLPTTVAISLALSVVKLSKSNAIIKKLIAAETLGCVSVICSDKTGTLTYGVMQVENIVTATEKTSEAKAKEYVLLNSALNSTAVFVNDGGKISLVGNSAECALLSYYFKKDGEKLEAVRSKYEITAREPFSSEKKYMATTVRNRDRTITFYKGALEVITQKCGFCEELLKRINNEALIYERECARLLAFAHEENGIVYYDGFVVFNDVIRSDVKESIQKSIKAGIDVMILTGDNIETAFSIAKKLGLVTSQSECVDGRELHELSVEELSEKIKKIKVVARCLPETKLNVVKALKRRGEVVAVTGDGVNDGPAVKNADVGIAMGDGSEITKEAADVILLNNSFSVIVKAIAFGRNIYRNFQSFLFFQLTVNFTAVGVILVFLILGFEPPFNALQLLWINVIMDGPLALSLGLEKRADEFLEEKPVKRTDDIVTKKTFLRIIIHSLYIVSLLVLQKTRNYLGVNVDEGKTSIFTLFVLFQLFNAINARELGRRSIFVTFFKNRLFIVLFLLTIAIQIVITCFFGKTFDSVPLDYSIWRKIIFVASTIVFFSELCKAIYSRIKKAKKKSIVIKKERIA